MRIYLSSRFARRAELRGVRAQLERLGHECVSRWLDEAPPEQQVGDWQARVALQDLEDVEGADVFLLFTDGADGPDASRGGRHVEFGYALALRNHTPVCEVPITIAVIGGRENVFHHDPHLRMFQTFDAWLATLGPAEGKDDEDLPEACGPDYARCRDVDLEANP